MKIDKRILKWNEVHGDEVWNLVGKPLIYEEFVEKRNKYYFEYCKANNWKMDKTEILAKKENLSNVSLRQYAMAYSKEGNEINVHIVESMELAEKQYNEIVDLFNGKPTNINFDNINELNYGNYFIKFINDKLGINISTSISKQSKITQFYYELFVRYGKDFFNNNPELFSYKLCEILKFHSSKINEVANMLNIPYYDIRNYAENHKIKEGVSKEDFILFYHSEQFCDKIKFTPEQIKKYYELLNSVDLRTRMHIVKELKPNYIAVAEFSQNHINPNTKEISDKLKSYISEVNEIFDAKENLKKQEELKIKLEERKRELEQKKTEQKMELLPIAKETIRAFIESDTKTIKEYCELFNISENMFERYVEVVKEYDLDLFNKYLERTSNISKQSYAVIMSKAKSIIDKIKNGVELEDGTKRDFTIIDYYLSTKLSLDELFNLIKKDLTAADVRAFRNFASKNSNIQLWGEQRIENYYNTDITLGIKFDSNNKIIPNSGHTLTQEEKEYIIKYIRLLNVPLCQQTVNIIQKEIIDGKIIVPSEPEDTKKI